MAGRNQHIIPQHYQRPFKKAGSKDQIWLYRKNVPEPKIVPIAKAAAQRDFYSKPQDNRVPALDDLITDYEQHLSATVRHLRSFQPGEELPPHQIAEVVTHLTVRSSYLRGIVEDGALAIASGVQSIADGVVNGVPISLPSHRVPSQFSKLTLENLGKYGLLDLTLVDHDTVCKLVYFGVREEGPELLASARSDINFFLNELISGSKDLGKSTQTKVLSDTLAPEQRREGLEKFYWSVQPGPDDGAILPDCIAISYDGSEWSAQFLTSIDEVEVVVVPLTPQTLAVGVKDPKALVDLLGFNENAAAAAHTFFLSANRLAAFETVNLALGAKVRSQLDELVESGISETVNEFLAVKPSINDHQEHGAGKSWVSEDDLPWSFTLSIDGFGDEAFAQQLGKEVSSIITDFSKVVPVAGIAELVFAADYNAAITSVDRGFSPSQELSSTETVDHVSTAMPLTVLRGEKVKTTAVFRSWVAEAVVSGNEAAKSDATQCVVHVLAHAAYQNLIRNKFPSQILRPVSDRYEGHLLSYTQDSFSSYFCASYASSSNEFSEMYRKMLQENLTQAAERIAILKTQYLDDGDMDALWPESASLIGNLMNSCARYLGCMRCREEQSLDERTKSLLNDHGLEKWAKLFQLDLKAFDERLENWDRFEELFFMNRHFERLSFQFGLLPAPSDDADAYIHVNG